MGYPLFLLATYLVINLGILTLGLGLGFLTHKIFPSIDLGSSIIAAVLSTAVSIHYFIRLMQVEATYFDKAEEREELEDEAPEFPIPTRTRRRHGRRK